MAKLAAVLVDLVTSATNKTFTYIVPDSLLGPSRMWNQGYGFLLALGFCRVCGTGDTGTGGKGAAYFSGVKLRTCSMKKLGSWHALWLIAIYAIRLRLVSGASTREQVADYL